MKTFIYKRPIKTPSHSIEFNLYFDTGRMKSVEKGLSMKTMPTNEPLPTLGGKCISKCWTMLPGNIVNLASVVNLKIIIHLSKNKKENTY